MNLGLRTDGRKHVLDIPQAWTELATRVSLGGDGWAMQGNALGMATTLRNSAHELYCSSLMLASPYPSIFVWRHFLLFLSIDEPTRSHLRCVSGGNYLEIRVENLVEVTRGIYADYSHAPKAKEKSGTYLHRTVSMLLYFHFSSSRKQYRYSLLLVERRQGEARAMLSTATRGWSRVSGRHNQQQAHNFC